MTNGHIYHSSIQPLPSLCITIQSIQPASNQHTSIVIVYKRIQHTHNHGSLHAPSPRRPLQRRRRRCRHGTHQEHPVYASQPYASQSHSHLLYPKAKKLTIRRPHSKETSNQAIITNALLADEALLKDLVRQHGSQGWERVYDQAV